MKDILVQKKDALYYLYGASAKLYNVKIIINMVNYFVFGVLDEENYKIIYYGLSDKDYNIIINPQKNIECNHDLYEKIYWNKGNWSKHDQYPDEWGKIIVQLRGDCGYLYFKGDNARSLVFINEDKISKISKDLLEEDIILRKARYYIFKKDGKKGLLGLDGNVILPCEFDNIEDVFYSDENYSFIFFAVTLNHKISFHILMNNNEIIKVSDYIYDNYKRCDNKLLVVTKDGKDHLLKWKDKTLEKVFDDEYDQIKGYSGPFWEVVNNNMHSIIDSDGKLLIWPFEYNGQGELIPNTYAEGIIGVSLNGLEHFWDIKKNRKIDVSYEDGAKLSYRIRKRFENGFAEVYTVYSGNWKRVNYDYYLIIDRNGKIIKNVYANGVETHWHEK